MRLSAALHFDVSIPNFGIQESIAFNDATREVFPGTHSLKNGYAILNEAPERPGLPQPEIAKVTRASAETAGEVRRIADGVLRFLQAQSRVPGQRERPDA